jgi:hypothetical protein
MSLAVVQVVASSRGPPRPHLTPRPLGLANPLARVPLSTPLEGSPRCEAAPRFDELAEREDLAGVMNRDVVLEDVGGLSTKEVSVVLIRLDYR